ncbi:MAG: drug/metabolite transporter (DMT)-like permease [Parasphingorhabdus sp.]
MNNTAKGLLWVVLSGLFFVFFIASIRYVGSNMPAVEAAFLRYLISIIILIPLIPRNKFSMLRTRHLPRYALRGFVHALGVMLWFFAITRIPIAEATALNFTSPIFAAIGAILFLHEKATWTRVLAIVIGFVGVLIIIRPGSQVLNLGALAVLLSAPLFAVSKLLVKTLVIEDSSMTTVIYLSIFATLTMLVPAIYVWVAPSIQDLLLLVVAAALATASHYCLAQGLKLIDVLVAQPADYLQLVWSTLMGMILFAEQPVMWVWVGGAVIICGVVSIARLEAVRDKA